MKRKQVKKGTIKRLFKTIRGFYPVMLPVVMVCIVFSAAVSSIPAIFMQNVIALAENSWQRMREGSKRDSWNRKTNRAEAQSLFGPRFGFVGF